MSAIGMAWTAGSMSKHARSTMTYRGVAWTGVDRWRDAVFSYVALAMGLAEMEMDCNG